MRRKSINSVKENEVLAKDIYGSTDTILMVSGMVLKREYIERLKQLNIDYIYVEDDFPKEEIEKKEIEERIFHNCKDAIESIYEKFSYCGDVELKQITVVASQVIYEVLQEPNVLYCIESVKKKHESVYVHSLNVCALSVLLALKIGLERSSVEDIAIGSLIHDLGYLYLDIPGVLENMNINTFKNVALIKKHVIYGYTEVEHETWLSKKAKNIILSHHEFYDGTGYPLKLSGSNIDIETKVVCICNHFDRLINSNSEAMKIHEAVEYIIAESGKKFDPIVVKAFSSSVARFPNGLRVITDSGEVGVVIKQNSDFPTRPIICIIQDKNGKKLKETKEINLVEELSVFIDEYVEK